MKAGKSMRQALSGLLLLGTVALSHQALAHKLNLFAYPEGDTVSVEGYFADGKRARNSTVKVLDSSGNVLVEGKTDEQGKYLFKVPKKTDLRIILNAGMGHQGEYLMKASELEEGNDAPPVPTTESTSSTSGGAAAAEGSAPVTNSELDATVYRAVNKAIEPLVRELTASRQHTSISELVGAIGYIFGLMGIFAFYKARQISGKGEKTEKSSQG